MADVTVEKVEKLPKLSVTMKGSGDVSLGSRTINECNPDATLDGYLKAGNAIFALCGAVTGDIKRVRTYALMNV